MACEPWPIVWPCDGEPTYAAEILDAATSAAQALLYSLTGSRFGVCETTERYRPRGQHTCWTPQSDPRGRSCCAIQLERRPVRSIVAVEINGALLDDSDYHLESGARLVRRGGCWPSGVDCGEPPVRVTYTFGIPLRPAEYEPADDPEDDPVLVRPASPWWGAAGLAMGELAREFAEGLCGRPCALPSRMLSMTRSGVTIAFSQPEQWYKLGLTGLPLSDAFIRSANPTGRRMASGVYSPDFARRA